MYSSCELGSVRFNTAKQGNTFVFNTAKQANALVFNTAKQISRATNTH
jgi:hypothetical protein